MPGFHELSKSLDGIEDGIESWFHSFLPKNTESHKFGHQDLKQTENAQFLESCAKTMIVSGITCFIGSVAIRFESTDYENPKSRSGQYMVISQALSQLGHEIYFKNYFDSIRKSCY